MAWSDIRLDLYGQQLKELPTYDLGLFVYSLNAIDPRKTELPDDEIYPYIPRYQQPEGE